MTDRGDGECLQNEMREPYAHMEIFDPATTSAEGRIRTLDESERAYPENDGSSASAGFFSEEGQLSTKKSGETPERPERKTKLFNKLPAKIDRRDNFLTCRNLLLKLHPLKRTCTTWTR
jgi:hypothetical protein